MPKDTPKLGPMPDTMAGSIEPALPHTDPGEAGSDKFREIKSEGYRGYAQEDEKCCK